MAAPALMRWAWPGAAVLAAAAIAAGALSGTRPEPGLVRFEAAGVMRHIAPERVREVHVMAGERRWRFTRGGSGGWTVAGASDAPGDVASRLEGGLRFLHVSAPQRVMAPDELQGALTTEFGLEPPRYTIAVQVDDADAFVVEFGAANASGLAQYARIAGRGELLLLPRFVGAAWEAATGIR